jgi:hypothetical protein
LGGWGLAWGGASGGGGWGLGVVGGLPRRRRGWRGFDLGALRSEL